MEKIYAFTDESGSFGWDLDNKNTSTHFIITAIIVRESDVDAVRTAVADIRDRYFPNGEIKSSRIKRSYQERRKKIIEETLPIPYKIFSVVVEKKLLEDSRGLRFKQSFYKFMNNIVHKELRAAFKNLVVVADEIGGSDYMQSFCKYVEEHSEFPNLYGESEFSFENSKSEVIVQLADLISGTLSFLYDEHKKDASVPNYQEILKDKIIRIEQYPKTYVNYNLERCAIASEYDKDIAEICLHQAVDFINKYKDDTDELRQAQLIVLKYLLFRFMNNDTRAYIPTSELLNQLEWTKYGKISVQTFRKEMIGGMRDARVIISGSHHKKGYKIPSKKSEIEDFLNHDISIILPMLERLKKCRDTVKLGTCGAVDLYQADAYKELKAFIEKDMAE